MAQRLYQRVDDGPLEPAEFRSRRMLDGGVCYDVACPRCGHVSTLDAEIHSVRRGGAVTPIWPCASESCALIEWLVLTEEVT
jgi:hypothetical protein